MCGKQMRGEEVHKAVRGELKTGKVKEGSRIGGLGVGEVREVRGGEVEEGEVGVREFYFITLSGNKRK